MENKDANMTEITPYINLATSLIINTIKEYTYSMRELIRLKEEAEQFLTGASAEFWLMFFNKDGETIKQIVNDSAIYYKLENKFYKKLCKTKDKKLIMQSMKKLYPKEEIAKRNNIDKELANLDTFWGIVAKRIEEIYDIEKRNKSSAPILIKETNELKCRNCGQTLIRRSHYCQMCGQRFSRN